MRFRSALRKTLIIGFMSAASMVQAAADRATELGHRMICMCGCTQLLSECNMINCSAAEPMRAELRKHIEAGEDDKTILAAFLDKYGTRVMSTPPQTRPFYRSVWIMPFAALGLGGAAVIFFMKRRGKTSDATLAAAAPVDTSKYDREIEEELRRLTPED